MNSKIKNKKNHILFVVFILVMMGGFGLGKVEKASAGSCVYLQMDEKGKTTPMKTAGVDKYKCEDDTSHGICGFRTNESSKDIASKCKYFDSDDEANKYYQSLGGEAQTITKKAEDHRASQKETCPGIGTTDVISWINCFFLIIANFLVIVLKAIFTLFISVINSDNISKVIGNPIIYQIWTMVRDVLNIAFILAILFSAFATIFQIQKYSYKNILLTILIMALLVNFSFPIARVIIDISNVLMYSFVQGFGITSGDGGFISQIFQKTGFDTLVSGITDVSKADTTYLVALVVFLFIFAMTILVLAVLFVIRLVALAILVIFSPIAFVGPTLPFLSKYSGDWWDNLFKYSFFGPIMVFMIYVSLKMMTAISSLGGSMQATASKTGDASSIVAKIAFFAIPIVILWFGMAVAQKMSIAGAGAAVGAATKFGKGAGKKYSGYDWTKKRFDAYKAERKTRADEKFKKNWGKTVGQKFNNWQDAAQAALPKVPWRKGKTKDPLGTEAAQKRLDVRMTNANKEAIKNKSEGKEGEGTIDLVGKISTSLSMTANARAASPKDDKINRAAEVKQAMSRGKEFELEVDRQISAPNAAMTSFINDLNTARAAVGQAAANRKEVKAAYYSAARKVIDEGEKAK